MQNLEELLKENKLLKEELRFKTELLDAQNSTAIAVYEFNLTKDVIEQEIVLETVNGPFKLIESLGLTPPCKIKDVFEPLCLANIDDNSSLYWCLKFFDKDYLIDSYNNGKKELAFEYRRRETAPGPRYLRQTLLIAEDPHSGDIIVKGNSKDVTNRYRMLGNVSRKDEDVTHAAILQTLSDLFYATYFIDFTMKSYIALSTSDELRTQVGAFMNAEEALLGCCDIFVVEEFQPEVRKFFTLNNIKEELKFKNHISREFKTKSLGWVRATFIASDWNGDGSIASVILTVLEINDEKKRQIEEQDARERAVRAEEASRAKTSFLFNMSHDIRTPMNAILGYTEIGLKHKGDDQKTSDSLEKIKIAGNHLLNLINDILEMSRIEAGKLVLTDAPLDLRKVIDSQMLIIHSLAASKDIDFELNLGEINTPYIYADELHLNEVIINLISNAIKYTPHGGKVIYSVCQFGDVTDNIATFRFEVSDNGIGMSEEFQSHLFESFSRDDSAEVAKIEGTGLGLSIVKRIVDLAGGVISAKSFLGKGSVFTVELPFKVMSSEDIAVFEKEEITNSTTTSDKNRFKGKRVLLAEDNEMNREIASEILSEAGFIVEEAEDGEAAVQAVAKNGHAYYDFILMDIQMPIMNGYEATKSIRGHDNGDCIPIIALSANAFEEDKAASINAGMNDHVAKPINVTELFTILSKYL